MKKIIFTLLIAIACSLLSFAGGVFTDVNETDWFASAVDTVYELKYMNGTGEGAFSPKGTVTVGQGITVAARIFAEAKGEEIAEKDGEWYQMYVDYAIENKIITDKQFDSYTRPALRHEIATLYASAVDDEKLKAINDVDLIVDVPKDAPYYEDLRMLYNAGILVGNDKVGTFQPQTNITRAEFATMTSRIAKEDLRVKKVFSNVMSEGDAHDLIYANIMMSYKMRISNGWLYDNKNRDYDTTGGSNNVVAEYSDEFNSGVYRDFDEVSDGRLTLDMIISLASENDGVYIGFQDKNENVKVQITSEDGMFILKGKTGTKSSIVFPTNSMTEYVVRMELDLDKNIAYAYINGQELPAAEIEEGVSLSRLSVATTKEGKGVATVSQVHLMQNYAVIDRFMALDSMKGKAPYTMDTVGEVEVSTYQYEDRTRDKYSARINANANTENYATKTFPAISTDGVYETFLMLPKGNDGAYFAIYSADKEIIRIESKNGAWYCGDVKLRDFTENVWQILRIETDVDKKSALIRINGKKTQTVNFDCDFINKLAIGFNPKEKALMWFDDVSAYGTVEHADYPSYPKVAESKDYNIGIHMCDLWRDADSGEGWDAVSAFADIEPVLGYYDEGTVEVADWEIKMMVEHGIDFQNIVWYPPIRETDKPLKTTHNGGQHIQSFMNAKYSDLMKFAIIFCCEDYNSRYVDFRTFKKYTWPYWKEHFFSDERYMRIDNKAVISLISLDNFIDAMGGANGARECLEFMREDIKTLGYDGMIILGNSPTSNAFGNLGFDGSYWYNFSHDGNSAEHQMSEIKKYAAKKDGFYGVPTISVGFNDVGRTGVNVPKGSRVPLITPEDHVKVAEYIRDDILAKNEYGNWKDNTLFVSTWNEYSEGTYVSPAAPNGYEYLETIRKVFTDDKSSHASVDVKLTDAQKNRISKLYPDHQPIRRLMLPEFENIGVDMDNMSVVKSWKFTSEEKADYDLCKGWASQMNCNISYAQGKTFKVSATSNDPAIYKNWVNTDTSDFQYLHLRMKTDEESAIEVFYSTTLDSKMEGTNKYVKMNTVPGEEFVDYYFPLFETPGWEGMVTTIRIDPLTSKGVAEIELIELLSKGDFIRVYANGNEMDFDFVPEKVGNDVKVTANPNRGFFTMLNFFYTWNRFEGKLMVESKDTRAYFTVGSNKAVVDGKEVRLSNKFELVDGLPVFYLKELCKIFDYKITVKGNNYEIKSTDTVYVKDGPGEWNFNRDGDLQNWRSTVCTPRAEGGFAVLDQINGSLHFIVDKELSLDCSKFTKVEIAVVVDKDNLRSTNSYFATVESPAVDAEKMLQSHKFNFTNYEDGDIYTFQIPLNHSLWKGTLRAFRVDFSLIKNEPVKIDYIKLLP